MKPKETNTAAITPTEAHYTLRRCIIFSAPDEGAQLIADSEARALAAIHHELNEARNAERLARVQLDSARAERDAERARLDWLEFRGPWEAWSEPCGEAEITLRGPIRAAIDAAMKENA